MDGRGPSDGSGPVGWGRPHLGAGGQFAGAHLDSTNVLFANGSVRPFASSMSPGVMEALATISGNETVGPFGGE